MKLSTEDKSQTANGVKLLAILAVGAASGGCLGGPITLGLSPEAIAAFAAAEEASTDHEDKADTQGQQQ